MTHDTRTGAKLTTLRDALGLTVAQGRVEGMGAEAVAEVQAWVDERRARFLRWGRPILKRQTP